MAREALFSCSDHPTACAAAEWLGRHPAYALLAAGALIASLFLAGLLLSVRGDRRARARFDAFVHASGGTSGREGEPVGELVVSGRPARVSTFRTGTKTTFPWTRYAIEIADPSFEMEIRDRRALATAGSFVDLGDPAFDENFLVSTNDEPRTRRIMTASVRRLVCEAGEIARVVRSPFSLRVHQGRVIFEAPGKFDGGDFDRRFRLALQAGAAIADGLGRSG
jgi:hypothetical protein